MQVGLAQCVNKGMQRDYSMDKASQEFAYENKNIRITTTGNNSFLSVTNEKSTEEIRIHATIKCPYIINKVDNVIMFTSSNLYPNAIPEFNTPIKVYLKDGTKIDSTISGKRWPFGNIELSSTIIKVESLTDKYEFVESLESIPYDEFNLGTVLGSCVANNKLILFTKTEDLDNIYSCSIDTYTGYAKTLYSGNLGFDLNNPIECTFSYEADDVQKVYWVDGINQPRVINICNTYDSTESFDFVPSVNDNLNVSIEKEYNGTGNFKSGIIQYYITAYKKFGSETNIVYQSPLYYISPSDRGGKIDETQTCSFKISITPSEDFNKDFDYVRVYSLIKTSLNGESQVQIIQDVPLNGTSTIQIIDTNTNTVPVAPTDIMFVGGNTIIASTIEQKDNTLFLGDITAKGTINSSIISFREKINSLRNKDVNGNSVDYKSGNTTKLSDCLNFNYKVLDYKDEDKQYSYNSNLQYPSSWIKGFKLRELYRVGLQFQNKTNEWSSIIWLEDTINKNYFPQIINNTALQDENYFYLNGNTSNNKMLLPYLKFTPNTELQTYLNEIKESGYVNYRLVMAEPTDADRCIITQGYVNPTLFRLGKKIKTNTNQNSWMLRPINKWNKHLKNINGNDITVTNYDSEIDVNIGSTNCFDESTLDNVGEVILSTVGVKLSINRTWVTSLGFIPTYTKHYGTLSIRFGFSKYNTTSEIMDSEVVWTDYIQVGDAYKNTVLWNLYSDALSDFCKLKYNSYKDIILNKAKELYSNATDANIGLSEGDWDSKIFSSSDFVYWDKGSTDRNNLVASLKDKVQYIAKSKDFIREKTIAGGTSTVFNANVSDNQQSFFLDASTVSFNSPNLHEVNNSINNSKFRIVGKTDITKVTSDYTITVEPGTDVEGGDVNIIYKYNFINDYENSNLDNSTKELLGLKAFPLAYDSTESKAHFVNIWNKSGSLVNRLDGEAGPTSILKSKIISNFWIGSPTEYYYQYGIENNNNVDIIGNLINWEYPEKIYDFKYVDESIVSYDIDNLYEKDVRDELFINKENFTKTAYIDRVSDASTKSSIVSQPIQYEENTTLNSNISIRYNSTNHGVFSFSALGEQIVTLPGYTNNQITQNQMLFYNKKVYPSVMRFSEADDEIISLVLQEDGNYKATVNSANAVLFNRWLNTDINKIKVVLTNIDDTINYLPIRLIDRKKSQTEFVTVLELTFNVVISTFIYNNDGYYRKTPVLKEGQFGISFLEEYNQVNSFTTTSKSNSYLSNLGGAELFNSRTLDSFGYYTFKQNGTVNKLTNWLPMNINSDYYYDSLDSTIANVVSGNHINNSIWIAEFYRDLDTFSPYGGTTESAIELNTFIPISEPFAIGEVIHGLEGDTYFQRWDSLRVYPLDEGEKQSVVDTVSLMLETHINLDGRSDINRGRTDVVNIRPENIQDTINNVYSQSNNYTTSSVLDTKFDDSTHPTLYTWSLAKQTLSEIDSWTKVNLSRAQKLDGDKGVLTKIKRWNNQLLAFQEKGIAIINFNQQAVVGQSEGVPIEIAASGKVNGHYYISSTQGCKNKWSIIDSPYGIYFIDSYNKSINILNENIQSLTTLNLFEDWINQNEKGFTWNPVNYKGFKTFYDSIHKEVYFINDKYTLCYNELLQQFTSFYDYQKLNTMSTINGHIYGIKDNILHRMFEGDNYCNLFGEQKDYSITYKINKDPFIDKTWTNIEYRTDIFDSGNIQNNNANKIIKETFDSLEVWDEYQFGKTELNNSKYPNAKVKFRIWRTDIPRDTKEGKGLNRIRNPWIMLKLSKTENTNKRMEFHDLVIKYLQ